jgi:hypothetical protein
VLLDELSFLGKNAKLAPKYTGPHVITRLVGDKNVELLLNNGKAMVVHVNRIKLFRTLDNLSGYFAFSNGRRGCATSNQRCATSNWRRRRR